MKEWDLVKQLQRYTYALKPSKQSHIDFDSAIRSFLPLVLLLSDLRLRISQVFGSQLYLSNIGLRIANLFISD
jgi:hypothetical protein